MTHKNKSACSCSKKCTLSTIGIIFIAFGIPIAVYWPQIFQKILISQMHIGPTSKSFSEWKKPSLPLFMDIYFFNWTNPQDFTNQSTKPILVELGPYRYREQQDKVNLTWNDEESTVSYRQISTFHFDAEGSNGTLEDKISTVNLVTAGANAKSRFAGFWERSGISLGLTMNKEQIAITKTAAELMFDGYESGMLTDGLKYKKYMDFGEIPYDKVGWFYMRNNTPERSNVYTVHTGLNDLSKFGKIQFVDDQDKNYKFSGRCGDYYGSTGEFYPFGQTREKPIELLTADMCKTLEFDYEKDIEVHGLKAYKYGGDRFIDNGTKYSQQTCFCDGDCMPSGVMNITKCRYDSPVFMSLPHYLYGDPFYQNQVEGLNPTKEKHEFFVAVEPVTGVPVKVAARLQANILIRKNSNIRLFKDIKDTYIPVMWVEHLMTLDEASTAELKQATVVPSAGRLTGLVMVIIGIFLQLCVRVFPLIYSWVRRKESENEIPMDQKKSELPLLEANTS